jgi:hypothetical protein
MLLVVVVCVALRVAFKNGTAECGYNFAGQRHERDFADEALQQM